MADTAATPTTPSGGEYLVSERLTAQAVADELTISGLPQRGRIHKCSVSLISGTGSTTVQPELRRVADASDEADDMVLEAAAAAARFNPGAADLGALGTPYYAPEGKLYLKHNVDGGNADNVIEVEIIITAGWRVSR